MIWVEENGMWVSECTGQRGATMTVRTRVLDHEVEVIVEDEAAEVACVSLSVEQVLALTNALLAHLLVRRP